VIYLASPYTHVDPAVREQRFQAACHATARLLQAGHAVFSPIVHGHPLTGHGLPVEWPWREPFARETLARCDRLVVLHLPAWRDSAGVTAEIGIALEWGMPVGALTPDGPEPASVGSRAETAVRTKHVHHTRHETLRDHRAHQSVPPASRSVSERDPDGHE